MKKKQKKVSLFERVFKFRSEQERLKNSGTAEHLDIPPGRHFFQCSGHARFIHVDEKNTARQTYVFKAGRWPVTVPADVLITVQCANDIEWTIETSQAAEVVDPTRIEVPLDIQNSNAAHVNLRHMIDRFMRGGIDIRRPQPEMETEEDKNNFSIPEHPFTRYEQRAYEEDNPPPPVSHSSGSTEQPVVAQPPSGEVK